MSALRAAKPDPCPSPTIAAGPDACLALDLVQAARHGSGLLFVDASGARIERLAEMARAFDPAAEVLVLPAWDSLPYDRTPPSPAIMGQRVHALARLAEAPAVPRLVLTSARALLQLAPAASHWADARLRLAPGDTVDEDGLRGQLAEFGYTFDEHVDQAGDVAIRGHVIDVFPGAAPLPVRLKLEDGRIRTIHRFDPVSQRSVDDAPEIILRPVVEAAPEPEQAAAEADRMAHPNAAGDETMPIRISPSSLQASLLDYAGGMRLVLHGAAPERWRDVEEAVAEAYAAATAAARVAAQGVTLPKPARLCMAADALQRRLDEAGFETLDETGAEPIPRARGEAELVEQIKAGARTVVAAPSPAAVLARLKRRGRTAREATGWEDALRETGIAILKLDLAEGFERDGVRLLAAPPALTGDARRARIMLVEEPPRLTDVVVHQDHGVCRLAGLRDVDGEERLALGFHEDTELLVPVTDLARIWRYGSAAGTVALDRVHGDVWRRRRDEIEAEIADTAAQLAEAAARRARTAAPVIEPKREAFARVVDRFAFAPSPDQHAAIEAVLEDLRSGRPMDRLICGDVGFGKTEVALRAAAAVALAGFQVAIVAPTTVLARQHLDGFRKRLAGTGVRVEALMRGSTGAEAAAVRDGLADGSIAIVVGTQAIASDKVRFARLGLVVIDEEQRFGDGDKRKLTALRSRGGAVHAMVMTAAPIPRTLQAAMVGLRDISVIAMPPQRRQPTRTFVLPFGEDLVRQALLREHGRGGQSFVVAPRIEDLAPLAAKLRAWTPALSVATAHGRLKPEALEQLVSGFARGEHDVLLATNIIEAGLDIPCANTILITGAHRFGLAQLHQMRGRVGRGGTRGVAYVLTEPGAKLAAPTVRRLQALETYEGLGAGVGIALADMDTRGAGDLFGAAQARHVQAMGTELYQHILARALRRLAGQDGETVVPVLHTEVSGRIPVDIVPESNVRLDLYRRLARLPDAAAAYDFEDEVADRFGAISDAFAGMIAAARVRLWCAAHGVRQLDAGPSAVALTLAGDAEAAALAGQLDGAAVKRDRVILPLAVHDPAERLRRLLGTLP